MTSTEPQQDQQDQQQTEPGQTPETDGGNREAAKYRRQLRETQAERDALRDTVTAMQRAEVERIAGDTLAKPAALWSAGVELSDLLNDGGGIDPGKVTEAATGAAETLGLQPARRFAANDTNATRHDTRAAPPSWSDVLTGRTA